MQLFKLLFINLCGTLRHKLAGILHLRESGNIAKIFGAAKYHCQTIKSYSHTTVRRCGILIGVYQKTEFRLYLLIGKTQNFEHLLLKLGIGDSYRAAAKFGAVKNKIIAFRSEEHTSELQSFRKHLSGIALKILQTVVVWHGKGVVHSVPVFGLVVEFKEWKVGYPKEIKTFGNNIKLFSRFKA